MTTTNAKLIHRCSRWFLELFCELACCAEGTLSASGWCTHRLEVTTHLCLLAPQRIQVQGCFTCGWCRWRARWQKFIVAVPTLSSSLSARSIRACYLLRQWLVGYYPLQWRYPWQGDPKPWPRQSPAP
eukprot:739826-Amphidinium_carterae.1